MSHSKGFLVLGLLLLMLFACAGPGVRPEHAKGVYHVVKRGETLWSISKAYHVSLQEIAELNNITNASSIEAGNVIFIPGAEQTVEIPVPDRPARKPPAAKEPPPKKIAHQEAARKKPARTIKATARLPQGEAAERLPAKTEAPPEDKRPAAAVKSNDHSDDQGTKNEEKAEKPPEQDRIEFDRKRFIWPVKGNVLSRYGIQPNGLKNNGIKIAAKEGTPVLAVASGDIMYSDTLKYYGETVIVRHDDNFSTVYTALKSRGVKTGDHVKKGERIALVGKPDSNGQPCLYFEIRQMSKPRNPLFFLP